MQILVSSALFAPLGLLLSAVIQLRKMPCTHWDDGVPSDQLASLWWGDAADDRELIFLALGATSFSHCILDFIRLCQRVSGRGRSLYLTALPPLPAMAVSTIA